MRLTRLVIEDFRKFTGKVVIDDVQPGLNIFCGPNEAGKTTIATALRTVFLEKHRSATLKHLLPWQPSSGQPRVEAEFVTGEKQYLLRKQFLSRARCELICNGTDREEGDAAEDVLAAMLRFSRQVKGSGAAEYAGVPGLLWISQGQAQDVAVPVVHAANHLREALSQLSGSRIEGGEDTLIATANGMLRELVTERTRKPTGPYADVIELLQQAVATEQQLHAQETAFQSDAQRQVRLREELVALEHRKPWEALEKQAAEAQGKVAELRAAKSDLEQLVLLNAATREKIALLRERDQDAAGERAALARLEAQYEQARNVAAQATAELAQLSAERKTALEELAAARKTLARAASREQAVQLQNSLRLLQANADRLNDSVTSASILKAQINAVQTRIVETDIKADSIDRLKTLEAELVSLEAKLEANATRVEYRLNPHSNLTVDGKQVTGSGEILVMGRTSIDIADVGTIAVISSVSNIAGLSGRYEEAQTKRDALLLRLGVASLAEAQQRQATNRDSRRELEGHKKLLSLHAPDGLEALEEAARSAQRQLEEARSRIGAIPDATHVLPLLQAEQMVADRVARLESLEERNRELFSRRSELAATEKALLDQLTVKRATLESPEWLERQVTQKDELERDLAEESMRGHRIEAARKRVDALESQVGVDDVERFMSSAKAQRTAHSQLKYDLSALSAKLEQQGAAGLGERLAEVRATVEQLTRRRNELARRADALSLLVDLLVQERDKTVRQLQAPLMERLDYYFRRLFPQTVMTLDENLSLSTVSRQGMASDMKYLSFGTQEQLGILARLAYADLLKDSGVPTLLLLDDACVHTDSTRRQHIKRALLEAARRHQILVFTCHPHDWDDMGILPRRIEDLCVPA
jgi:hypothetical protein